jgi:hypothetical protein
MNLPSLVRTWLLLREMAATVNVIFEYGRTRPCLPTRDFTSARRPRDPQGRAVVNKETHRAGIPETPPVSRIAKRPKIRQSDDQQARTIE